MKIFGFIALCIFPLYAAPGVADNRTNANRSDDVKGELALGLETVAEGVETIAVGMEEISKGLRSVASAFRSLSKNDPVSSFEETLLDLAQKVITEKLSDRIVKEIERMDNSSKDPDQLHQHPFDEVIGAVAEPSEMPDLAELTTEAGPVFTIHEEALPEHLVTDSSTGLPAGLEAATAEEEVGEIEEDGEEVVVILINPVTQPLPVDKEEIIDIYATTAAQRLGGDEETLEPELPEVIEIIQLLKPLTQPFPDPATEASVVVTDKDEDLETESSDVQAADSEAIDFPVDTGIAIFQLMDELAAEEELARDPEGPTEPEGPDDLMGDQCEGHHRQMSEGCLDHYFGKLGCPYDPSINWSACYRYYEKCRKFQARGNRKKGFKFCCQSLQCHQGITRLGRRFK